MRFVNRRAELSKLDSLLRTGGAGLVVIWGRRRIGKTRLLLEWCRKHGGLYTVADLSAAPVQRRYVSEALAARFEGFSDVEYPDWRSLLRAIGREALRTGWRGPLVLDEFPYWVETSRELPSVLQNFLDHEAKEAGLSVVVSGSSQHMVHGLTLDPGAPLFGRAVANLHLQPMSPKAMGEALRVTDPCDLVRHFAVWGGVPRYWELAAPYAGDLDGAVERLLLDPAGPLHLEPDHLLVEERPPAMAVRPVLDAIGAGAHRVSEIAGRLGVPATSLARGLARLCDLGLVTREQPHGEPPRRSKRSLYKIADPFFRAWFRVVAPQRALLACGTRSSRISLWKRNSDVLFSQTWEDLCRQAVPRLSALEGSGAGPLAWGVAGRYWRGTEPEWDVVAASEDGDRLLVGEVKWCARPVTEAELVRWCHDLSVRALPQGGRGAGTDCVMRVLFVPRAVPRKRVYSGCRILTAEEVLRAYG